MRARSFARAPSARTPSAPFVRGLLVVFFSSISLRMTGPRFEFQRSCGWNLGRVTCVSKYDPALRVFLPLLLLASQSSCQRERERERERDVVLPVASYTSATNTAYVTECVELRYTIGLYVLIHLRSLLSAQNTRVYHRFIHIYRYKYERMCASVTWTRVHNAREPENTRGNVLHARVHVRFQRKV